MRVVFSRTARRDRREIEAYYRHRSPAASNKFRDQLGAAFRYIIQFPEAAPHVTPILRSKIIPGFPYSIVYSIVGNQIRVAAIASHHQEARDYDDR